MSAKKAVCSIALTLIVLAFVSCGNKATTDIVISLELHVSGDSCEQYSEFSITWDKENSSKINCSALIGVLMEGDRNGTFLHDCSPGRGLKYTSVVKSIEQLSDKNGIKVILIQKIWLDGYDVVPNMESLLRGKEKEIFYGHRFQIY